MKLSFLHFMAIIATVVESKPLVPTILGAPDDDETAAHAALAAAFYADAANFLEANAADQHDQDASTEGRMLDRRRRKKNKDDDDDDAEKRMGFGGKRLKMYCEEKFKWQEVRECHNYCVEVDGDIKAGSELRLMECNTSYKQRFKMERGRVLRPAANRKLCVKGDKLRECDTELEVFGGNKFEIHDKDGNCFTQNHHPKPKELVEFRDCRKARNSHTNLWRFA
mmetsp:Transcript_19799/g.40214  ORF Transcript_19799/g.40214 Transcript_19799/m.40214 type:complete len:224 (+) Transcript_19799:287-958(+)